MENGDTSRDLRYDDDDLNDPVNVSKTLAQTTTEQTLNVVHFQLNAVLTTDATHISQTSLIQIQSISDRICNPSQWCCIISARSLFIQ